MESVTIPLSASQRSFLEAQVSEGAFASITDYLAALIDAEAGACDRAAERLEALLIEGLDGPATAWTRRDTDTLRQQALNER